jgi:hypothetical protein
MAKIAAIKNVLSPISDAKITPQLLRKPSANPEPIVPIAPSPSVSGRVRVTATSGQGALRGMAAVQGCNLGLGDPSSNL